MAVIIDFIRQNLFWILFVLGVGILLYVFTKLEHSTKLSIKKFFSGKVLTATVIVVLWFIWYKRGGSMVVQNANFWMPMIALTLVAGYNFIGGLKYETQHIVCGNGFHGSYSKPPRNINGFLIFAIDSFNAGGLSWDYAGRILVLREETVEFCDEGAVSIARPTPCNTWAYDLEPEVKEFIENNKFLKGRSKQVFYGWFDNLEKVDFEFEKLGELEHEKNKGMFAMLKKELGVDNPKVSKLFWLYKNQCKALNKQTEQYDATVEAVEKGVEHHKRIKDAYVEKQTKPNDMQTGHEEY